MASSLQILLAIVIGFTSCEFKLFGVRDMPVSDDFSRFLRSSRPATEFFVGTFLSNPVYDMQVNMWNIYTAAGLPVELINDNLTISISREGVSKPPSYRIIESSSNATLLDYVFQLRVHNTTSFYGRDAEYIVGARGRDLTFIYNVTGNGIVRVEFSFDGGRGGLSAKYVFPLKVRGKRSFGRRVEGKEMKY